MFWQASEQQHQYKTLSEHYNDTYAEKALEITVIDERPAGIQGIDGNMHLGALAPLGATVPARAPLDGLDCSTRASRMAALGCGWRLWSTRRSGRRSCTMASKQPASIQRLAC
jgi:hypothetical protein